MRRGVSNVVVVEKNFLASGATGKSSACVRQHYTTPETCRMVLHALRFFENFAEHTGGRTASFTRVGYLLGVDDRLRVPMEKSVALQQSMGIKTRVITPAEIREIEPRVRVDDFTAGCYEPDAERFGRRHSACAFSAGSQSPSLPVHARMIPIHGPRLDVLVQPQHPLHLPASEHRGLIWPLPKTDLAT